MQVIIDVPDDFYEKMMKQNGMGYIEADVVVNAFYNGTPLPKGHGRLIDADKLQNNISHDEREAFTKHQVWLKASIYNPDAQTIIEKSEEEQI